MVQRSSKEFTGILDENPGEWVDVIDSKGKVLFYATTSKPGDRLPDLQGKMAKKVGDKSDVFNNLKDKLDVRSKNYDPEGVSHWEEGNSLHVIDGPFYDPCEMCGKKVQLYEFYDDGERKACESCIRKGMGKNASKVLIEKNKVAPSEATPSAPSTFHAPSKIERQEVKYCESCKFRAVYNGAKRCVKCDTKKKKKK